MLPLHSFLWVAVLSCLLWLGFESSATAQWIGYYYGRPRPRVAVGIVVGTPMGYGYSGPPVYRYYGPGLTVYSPGYVPVSPYYQPLYVPYRVLVPTAWGQGSATLDEIKMSVEN